jgi:hypothetical protein
MSFMKASEPLDLSFRIAELLERAIGKAPNICGNAPIGVLLPCFDISIEQPASQTWRRSCSVAGIQQSSVSYCHDTLLISSG